MSCCQLVYRCYIAGASSHTSDVFYIRSMDFSVALLEILNKDSELSLQQVVEEAYKTTLKPWHGWISSAAYKVVNVSI